MVVGKGTPGITVGGIVLAHGAPLPLAQVTAPEAPGNISVITLRHAARFRGMAAVEISLLGGVGYHGGLKGRGCFA